MVITACTTVDPRADTGEDDEMRGEAVASSTGAGFDQIRWSQSTRLESWGSD